MSLSGYILGIIIDAVLQNQANSSQPDPIHVSAHYLEPSSPGAVEVRIREQRVGRRSSNITADLYQKVRMRMFFSRVLASDSQIVTGNGECYHAFYCGHSTGPNKSVQRPNHANHNTASSLLN